MKTILLIAIFLALAFTGPSITKKYDGVTIGNPQAPFHLEVFIDLLCSDCKHDHETWKQVFKAIDFNNQDKVQLTYHQSPNVSHIFGWPVVMVQHFILEKYGPEAALEYQDYVFTNQDQIKQYNDLDFQKQIFYLAKFVVSDQKLAKLGITEDDVVKATGERKYDLQARNSWKFGASKTITGTPEYYANGSIVANNMGWSVQQWVEFLHKYAGTPLPKQKFLE